jgi:hypothetical protein
MRGLYPGQHVPPSALTFCQYNNCNVSFLEPGRLHTLTVTVVNGNGMYACGFYPGPTYIQDRISVLCETHARGRFVVLAIQSEPETDDQLQICEIQVYGRRMLL